MSTTIKNEDLRIDVFRIDKGGQQAQCRGSFVKVEHIPTGITTTKFGRSQLASKKECIEEIEELIKIGMMH